MKDFIRANEKVINKPFGEKIDFSKKMLVVVGTSILNHCSCKRITGGVEAIENKNYLLFNFHTYSCGGGMKHECKINPSALRPNPPTKLADRSMLSPPRYVADDTEQP